MATAGPINYAYDYHLFFIATMHTLIITPTKLQITLPQLFLRLIGLFFVVISGTMGFFLIQANELQCRWQGSGEFPSCVLKKTHLGFYHTITKLSSLQKAELVTYKNRKGNPAYNVMLITAHGKKRVSEVNSSDYLKAAQMNRAISQYIKKAQSYPLYLGYLTSHWLHGFILLFTLVGLLLMVMTSYTTMTFNKTTNQLRIRKRSLFNEKETHHKLDSIKGVMIEVSYNSKRQKNYRVALQLADGKTLPLTTTYDTLLSPKIAVAKAINTFLDLKEDLSLWDNTLGKQKRLTRIAFIGGITVFLVIVALSGTLYS